MEEKNDVGIKHLAHQHLLILNENEKYGICSGCGELIDPGKSSLVYRCSNITSTASTSTIFVPRECVRFLLHKTCAELPPKIINPTNPDEILFFQSDYLFTECIVCGLDVNSMYYSSFNTDIYVCLKCALFLVQQFKKDPIFVHPSHSYHPLAIIDHPSSFKCYACKVNDNILDSSYRCTKCQFWIHKSCGDAPHSFRFQFHRHPLILSFFLPQAHRKFPKFCRICNKRLHWIEWLYCCRSCRYFTHFQCARSSPILSSSENETYPDLVHLPAADEISLNMLLEQFIKDKNSLSISSSSATNYMKHWSHDEHVLKLITSDELYERKQDDGIQLLCEGCVKPIRSDDGVSCYGCVPCKYFMHKFCAELPREIEQQPGETLFANKFSQPFKLFVCYGCEVYCNGMFYGYSKTPSDDKNHIGCVTLPKVIKHEAHRHQLDQVFDNYEYSCNACGLHYTRCKYICERCNFSICGGCIRHARTYEHRWDPHPLELIYDAGMVEEHEHDFDCEYCSREIDVTNKWFYHCSICDLSLHLSSCLEESSYQEYKYVKFGATDIIKDELHPHKLTFVLNKKSRTCQKCFKHFVGPILQCTPCNIIFCWNCYT